MRLMLLAAVVAALVAAQPAAAAAPPGWTSPAAARALARADLTVYAAPAVPGWWRPRATLVAGTITGHPCGGAVTVRWSADPAPAGVDARWRGYALDCTVVLNARLPWDWAVYCATVAHEDGHLAGWDHVDRPGALMYPEAHSDDRCAHRGRPYLARKGAR